MGENAAKIGRKLEGFGENLISDFGWIELVRDCEIKCTRSVHKKKSHGIDLFCKFNNPYINGNQGIIIECKNRQMQSINKTHIADWVRELINSIECAQSTNDLGDVDISDLKTQNTGLLLIHANDTWEEEKFYGYLDGLETIRRRNPINIFIAGNDKIDLWTGLFAKIRKDFNKEFSFLYPSLNEYSKETQKAITINAMFSKYIFAESTYFVSRNKGAGDYDEPHRQNIMFFFDEINVDNFRYAWSMFKHYQLQGVDRYTFVFYPRKKDDVVFVQDKFIETLKTGVPTISEDEARKICIDFIDNRSLSAIEVGGSK